MKAIIDTDALIGMFNAHDPLHRRAGVIAKYLSDHNIDTVILPTTLCEFARLASLSI
jgi:hypothetical protein